MRYLFIVALLTACVPTTSSNEPVISAFNGHTVTIEAWGINDHQPPGLEDIELAQTACKGATYLSTKPVNEYKIAFLFKC